jgi:predicted transcriptional regulator
MRVLWQRGAATAEQVRQDLRGAGRSLADSSVRTVLRRLDAKGYVTHSLEGRTFLYRPVEPAQNLAARAVRQIIDRFCAGSVERLLLGLVDHRVVGPEEMARVAKLVRRRGRSADKKGARQ